MTTMANEPIASPTKRSAAGAASWLALVAATSLGIAHAETVRAEIRLPRQALQHRRRYRLIVQSYDSLRATQRHSRLGPTPGLCAAVGHARRSRRWGSHRPHLARREEQPAEPEQGVVVAWVEPGEANLEFDARRARPTADSFYGVASSNGAEQRLGRDPARSAT